MQVTVTYAARVDATQLRFPVCISRSSSAEIASFISSIPLVAGDRRHTLIEGTPIESSCGEELVSAAIAVIPAVTQDDLAYEFLDDLSPEVDVVVFPICRSCQPQSARSRRNRVAPEALLLMGGHPPR